MHAGFTIIFALLGGVIGSFLNVCIDRLPRDESIIFPPSHCEHCQHRLAAPDLVPVFSYLWLKGHCRYCQAPVPRRILWVELTSSIMFALLYWNYGLSTEMAVMAFYSCLFLVIFVVDLEHGLILNKVIYPGMAAALVISVVAPQPWLTPLLSTGILSAAAGGGLGFILLLLVAIISRGGMGFGDVKLAALMGLAIGFPLVMFSLVFGAILGGIIGAALLVSKKRSRRDAIPFGPFLALAAMITMLWGNSLLYWYVGLM